MPEFEWMLKVFSVTDEQEALIVDELDGFVGGHGETIIVTLSAEGSDAVSVGRLLVHLLSSRGIAVESGYYDLLTRSEIARRLGVTAQAVGNWVRRDRQEARPFPSPFASAGGGVWLWADVNAWLRDIGSENADEVDYPTRGQIEALNCWLADQRGEFSGMRVDLTLGALANVFAVPAVATGNYELAAKSKRVDFAFAA